VGPVPAGLLFLLLVLRASIGATSSTGSFGVMIAAISASLASFSFLFFLLAVSFFTFLFVILVGGELARDTDAEVIEKASTCSLIGVPGWFVEVMLGRLEACLLAPAVAAAIIGSAATGVGRAGGVSARGVSVIRNVRGWVVLLIGEPVDTVAAEGVPGRELIDEAVTDPAREGLARMSGFAGDADVETLGDSGFLSRRGVVSIFNLPGCGRCFSLIDLADLLGETALGASV
jgi:hypothetical protein